MNILNEVKNIICIDIFQIRAASDIVPSRPTKAVSIAISIGAEQLNARMW